MIVRSHRTARFVFFRLRELFYQFRHPDAPWLNQQANEILDLYLRKTDCGFEIGSGRSTAWLARRVGRLTSIEGHAGWYEKVRSMLESKNLTNVDYRLVDESKMPFDRLKQECSAILDSIPGSLDFGLSDGLCRGLMAIRLTEKLKPGGLLIVDDAHWFLPSRSKTARARTFEQGPWNNDGTGEWSRFQELVKDWRVLWTSNGVSDTALFIKPS